MKNLWQNNSTPVLCVKLSVTAVLMFVFAIFIMPPLYDLFCDITGLNGKTGSAWQGNVNELGVDTSRTIKVQFLATNNENMPWGFQPEIKTITVHPGEPTIVNYIAQNTTQRDMVAQAVPSLVPYKAANYFHKTECFCFNSQPLDAGESVEMALVFFISPEIPPEITTLTLSYSLFNVTKLANNNITKI